MPLIIYYKVAIVLCELIACITGFIYWRHIKESFWKYFPVYLAIIVVGDTCGYILAFENDIVRNRNLYMYFVIPFEFLFYFWFVYQLLFKKSRLVFIFGTLFYILSLISEQLASPNIKSWYFLSLSYTVGNLVLLIFLFIYFLQFVQSAHLQSFYKQSGFWVAAGLLLFWLGTFPYFGLINLLLLKYKEVFIAYTWIMIILNYCMYACFAIAFICRKDR
jgi:hypothetical protein